jgi:thiamine-phosphate pyrophosphorylase
LFPPLYAILDPALTDQPMARIAQELANAGVRLMQLRNKVGPAKVICRDIGELISAVRGRDVRVILNDRPDIAALAGAGGVHLGQDDLPVAETREIVGSSVWVGVSTHNVPQLMAAARTSADYIAVGPVFPTGTKKNPDPVVGLEFIREARRLTRKPLVAIGGITVESAADVFRAGADAVAVIRDLLAAPEPGERVRQYLAIAAQAGSERG